MMDNKIIIFPSGRPPKNNFVVHHFVSRLPAIGTPFLLDARAKINSFTGRNA